MKESAKILKSVNYLGEIDNHIFRISGDEYIVILDGYNKENAQKTAIEIQESFGKPFNIEDKEIQTSVSIGIVFYPQNGYTVEEIFKKADLAMYKAKEMGRKRYKIYEEQMEE